MWNAREKTFSDPMFYDYTFPVRFPNVVFMVNNLEEAKKKIGKINRKISRMERFELSRLKIQMLAIS